MRRAAGLLESTSDSLRRGHWRVACRRYLMLEASGSAVPEAIRAQCSALLQRCAPDERRRMALDAQAWARMVGRGGAAGDAPWPEASSVLQGRTAADIRTQWRFPHGLT